MTFDKKLPNFLIAGEKKSGTTSLYRWMQNHPDVYLHPTTDMNYFISDKLTESRKWRDGEVEPGEWERTHSLEGYAKLFEHDGDYRAVGHKGADLLFWKPAHARIAEYLPDARFIFILRNPVTRAWSHYWNEVGKGREVLSFKKAMAAEKERSQKSAYARLHLSYTARGFYKESLEAFFRHVDRSRVLITILEQSRSNSEKMLSDIYKFIGVDENLGLELAGTSSNENWTMLPREWSQTSAVRPLAKLYERATEAVIIRATKDSESRRKLRKNMQSIFRKPASSIKMPDDVKKQLTELYAPHIESLEAFLGYEIPEWKK